MNIYAQYHKHNTLIQCTLQNLLTLILPANWSAVIFEMSIECSPNSDIAFIIQPFSAL